MVKLWIIYYGINHYIQTSNLNFRLLSFQSGMIYLNYHLNFPALYYTLTTFATFKV